jgi:hypothetical protein
MNDWIKFTLMALCVFGFTGLATAAFSQESDLAKPWTLATVEFDDDGIAFWSEDLGRMEYPDYATCLSRGEALIAYIETYGGDMRAIVACVLLDWATWDDYLKGVQEDFGWAFPPLPRA